MAITASQFVNEILAEFKRNPKGGSKYFEAFGEGKSDAPHCCKGISYVFKILGENVNGSNTVTLRSAILAAGGVIIANKWSDAACLGDLLLMHWNNKTDLHSTLDHACTFELDRGGNVIQTLDFNGNKARENKRFLRYKENVAYIVRFPFVSAEEIKTGYTGWAWNAAHTLCYHYTKGKLDTNAWFKGTGDWSDYWFFVGAKGYFVKNEWHQGKDGTWYWCGENGWVATSQWVKYKNQYYYVGKDGAPYVGAYEIDGAWYHFDEEGICEHDVILEKDGDYYYFGPDGKLVMDGIVQFKAVKGKLTVY